jgi:hypothetical protein
LCLNPINNDFSFTFLLVKCFKIASADVTLLWIEAIVYKSFYFIFLVDLICCLLFVFIVTGFVKIEIIFFKEYIDLRFNFFLPDWVKNWIDLSFRTSNFALYGLQGTYQMYFIRRQLFKPFFILVLLRFHDFFFDFFPLFVTRK